MNSIPSLLPRFSGKFILTEDERITHPEVYYQSWSAGSLSISPDLRHEADVVMGGLPDNLTLACQTTHWQVTPRETDYATETTFNLKLIDPSGSRRILSTTSIEDKTRFWNSDGYILPKDFEAGLKAALRAAESFVHKNPDLFPGFATYDPTMPRVQDLKQQIQLVDKKTRWYELYRATTNPDFTYISDAQRKELITLVYKRGQELNLDLSALPTPEQMLRYHVTRQPATKTIGQFFRHVASFFTAG